MGVSKIYLESEAHFERESPELKKLQLLLQIFLACIPLQIGCHQNIMPKK